MCYMLYPMRAVEAVGRELCQCKTYFCTFATLSIIRLQKTSICICKMLLYSFCEGWFSYATFSWSLYLTCQALGVVDSLRYFDLWQCHIHRDAVYTAYVYGFFYHYYQSQIVFFAL